MKIHTISSLLLLSSSLLLTACNDKAESASEKSTPKVEKIAVGTDINSIVKPQVETSKQSVDDEKPEYEKISWEDLELPGKGMEVIIKKYEKEIDSIPEGSLKEKEVMERMQADLNSAPVNEELDKKKIKLPGFVSPLEIDEEKGLVTEFLLVPYFGACIHVPPPPINMTLLIKLPEDQQIKLDDTNDPIWVSGVIHAESTVTKLAEAGYKITDVKVEPYVGEVEPQ